VIHFDTVFGALVRSGVEFTVIGGAGATIHGSARTGGGNFEALLAHSSPVQAFGIECLCLDLDKLIQVKRAAGRPKDLEAIAELEALREERGKAG
jgi:hypothetical protein